MRIWKNITQSRAAADSPRAVNTTCGFGSQLFSDSQSPQLRKSLLAAFPTPPIYTSQTTAYPRIKPYQHRWCLAIAKIASPANQVTIELLNHLFDSYTSPVTGQFPNSFLEFGTDFSEQCPVLSPCRPLYESQETYTAKACQLCSWTD